MKEALARLDAPMALAALSLIILAAAAPVMAQAPPAAPTPEVPARSTTATTATDTPPKVRRFAVGLRVRGLIEDAIGNRTKENALTSPVLANTFTTTSKSAHVGLGPSFEFQLTPKLVLNAELLYLRIRYQQVTEALEGTERKKTTYTENTKASYWDLPVLVRRQGFGDDGWRAKLYVAGGGTLRQVRHIRTGNEYAYYAGNTGYDEQATRPSRRNLVGATAAAGFRLVDDFGVKITPEVRYTRWLGSTFSSGSTRSPRDQVEVGIGFTF
ncbi:MAG: outer membrane beta-barrel protein [Acidobacteria bacterium]|nr:outer membrane beta-barrel protein [Acidobacteriota bacterium]